MGSYLEMSDADFALRQIKTDGGDVVSPQTYKYLLKLAKEWGVSVENIAWLQMKPYPMQGALYQMLKLKCSKEGLLVKGMELSVIQRPDSTTKRAGFLSKVTLFNQKSFDEALSKSSLDKVTVEVLRELREVCTHVYQDEGWASPETVKAPAMQNLDYLTHMGATRALDRTLRMIVRCEHTAASELPGGVPGDLSESILKELDAAMQGRSVAKPSEVAAPKQDAPEKPVERPKAAREIPQKPIKRIEEKPAEVAPEPEKAPEKGPAKPKDPKQQPITAKQVTLLGVQWESYCRDAAPGIERTEIEEKLSKLLRALYGTEAPKDLTVAQLEELVGLMTRREIEVTRDGGPLPPEKPEVKT